jgi:transposase-like protein
LPKSYFESTEAAAASETTAAAVEPGLKCPKCQSANTKRAGALNGRQRVKCHDCGKQSFAE